ncbi:MAG: hypothetical protein ACRDTC_24205 [Pseudonocardiaceae bacterium]
MTTSEEQLREFNDLPPSGSCRLIDFESVEILILESFPPQYVLVVTGTKPYSNMKVDLVPLVYIRQPEYWGIEVVGCLPGFGLPATAPYTISISLNGIIGTEGIEVIGATRSEQHAIPPDGQPGAGHTLFRRWVHSFEEDTEEVSVYRPFGFEFPPARGRDGFDIKRDGEFIRYDIGPADGLVEVPGRWKAKGPNEIVVHFNDSHVEPDKLHIVSCEDDVLRIAR